MNLGQKRGSSFEVQESELGSVLTLGQYMAILHLEGYGWKTRFVRNPEFQKAVILLQHANDNKWLAIEPDGEINENISAPVEYLRSKLATDTPVLQPKSFFRVHKLIFG